jgi:hypothetical protein
MVTIHEARSTSMDKRAMDKRRPEGDSPAGFITVASPRASSCESSLPGGNLPGTRTETRTRTRTRGKLPKTSRASSPARDEARQRATREAEQEARAETRPEARPNGAEGRRCLTDASIAPGGREARWKTGVGPTSARLGRSGPRWVPFVETADEVGGVLEVRSRLPGRMVVTDPTNEVLQSPTSAEVPGVQNLCNFPLFLVVDDYRGWFGLVVELTRQWVQGRGLQKRNVKEGMDLHSGGKVQLICMGRDLCEDPESSQALEVQFQRWSVSSDMTSEQPNVIANTKQGGC